MKILIFSFYLYSSVLTLPHRIRPLPFSKSLDDKGDGRIIGGESAKAGEFPYAAAIYYTTNTGRYFCGGALVSQKWVLTAGICVDGANQFTIELGSNRLNSDDPQKQVVAANTHLIHPNYDAGTYENSLGLIELRLPITYTDYIKPIYLPAADIEVGQVVSAIGWGQISDSNDDLSDLQTVTVTAVSNQECKIFFGDLVFDTTLCVEGNFQEGICFGDTGSPLVLKQEEGPPLHYGIATFFSGYGCETSEPSGFTRTHHFFEWIRDTISENGG